MAFLWVVPRRPPDPRPHLETSQSNTFLLRLILDMQTAMEGRQRVRAGRTAWRWRGGSGGGRAPAVLREDAVSPRPPAAAAAAAVRPVLTPIHRQNPGGRKPSGRCRSHCFFHREFKQLDSRNFVIINFFVNSMQYSAGVWHKSRSSCCGE